jgi:hypothetical protein
VRSMWEHISSETVSVYSRLLSGKWYCNRDQGKVQRSGPQEGPRDVGAMAGCGLSAGVSARQQAIEEQYDALFDVGGVEGNPLAHRTQDTRRVDEIRELWNYECKRPDGTYLYSEEFRTAKRKEAMVTKEAQARKDTPIYSGVLKYFPRALAEVARLSRVGNDQHNPGKPLHWDRAKSGDELDALTRHLVDAGTIDTDGTRHSAKVAWRALANLEKELEGENNE